MALGKMLKQCKNFRMQKISPFMFLIIGVSISLFTLFTKRTFDPFVLLCFIFVSIIESMIKRSKYLPSNILSLFFGLLAVISIKSYIVDFVVMKSEKVIDIPKESRVFFRPAMFKLNNNDLIILVDKHGGNSLGRLLELRHEGIYLIRLLDNDKIVYIDKRQIKGKIIYIIKPCGEAKAISEYLYDDTLKPNSIGRLSKVTASSGSSEYFYDKLGRATKTITGSGAWTIGRNR